MKKFFALLLVLCLLSSCTPRQSPQQTAPALTVIGVSQVGSESGFRVANSESMRSVFTEERNKCRPGSE